MFGAAFLIISELLCEAVDLRSGQKVLDVATGSGNTALAAARRFCEVTGVDYVPALLERGRERAAAERALRRERGVPLDAETHRALQALVGQVGRPLPGGARG